MTAKKRTIEQTAKSISKKCADIYGEDFVNNNELLIRTTARNLLLLERFDEELSNSNLIVYSLGSNNQKKQEINPIVKHRNDTAKILADNLEALQLTPRSKYKKTEGKVEVSNNDPTIEYFSTINQ